MLYNSQNQPIESTLKDKNEVSVESIPNENFPPPTQKPDWFDKQLLKIGGYAYKGASIPRYQVVWGMDPEVKHFAMGKMRMKYISIVDHYETLKGYNIIQTRKGKETQRFFLPPIEAHRRYMDPNTQQLTRNAKPGQIIAPVIVKEEKEIGLPLWVVEQWVPPEAFGDPVSWNNERYLVNPIDATESIDALGEYPENGRYIHFFDLLDYDEDGRTIYRPLDEGAIELVRANHVMNESRRIKQKFTTPESAKAERDALTDKIWAEFDEGMTKDMLDIKKHKAFNITPKG
jgi:hypothetical protein